RAARFAIWSAHFPRRGLPVTGFLSASPARPASIIFTHAAAPSCRMSVSPAIPLWRRPAIWPQGGIRPLRVEARIACFSGGGAADMKGGVAASLAAALQFLGAKRTPFEGSISFLITGDEEGPAINGTKKVVDWLAARTERPDCCILGEGTSEAAIGDTIKIG